MPFGTVSPGQSIALFEQMFGVMGESLLAALVPDAGDRANSGRPQRSLTDGVRLSKS